MLVFCRCFILLCNSFQRRSSEIRKYGKILRIHDARRHGTSVRSGNSVFLGTAHFRQVRRTFTCGCGDMLFKSKGRNKNPRRSEVLYRSFYMQRHERSYLKIQPEFTGRAVCLVVHAFDGGLVGCHLRCLSGGKYCKVGKKAVVFIGSHCHSSGGTLRSCLRYRKFASAYLT